MPSAAAQQALPPVIQQSMETINRMNDVLNTMNQKMDKISERQMTIRPTEGFQSSQNPYNTPSPNIQQAYEFRLGKRSLVDTVLRDTNL
jgi:hypothetical protein